MTKGLIELLAVVGAGTLVMAAIIIFLFRKEFKTWLLRPKYLDWCYKEDKEIRFFFVDEDVDINKLNDSNKRQNQSDAFKRLGDDRVKYDSSDFFCYEKDIKKTKEFIEKDGHRLIRELNEESASYKKTLIFA